MPIPLGYHIRLATFHHPITVEDTDNRPVGILATSTNIHYDQIAVYHLAIIKGLRLAPYPQLPLLVFTESDILHTFLALVAITINITDKLRCSASLAELVNLVFGKDLGS
nr:MAG: hypothetical protein [Bacteriophage sp.]